MLWSWKYGFEISSSQVACRDKLAALRLQIREEQTGGGEDEDDCGVKCHIKEMDDVLMRDVGDKIKTSGR